MSTEWPDVVYEDVLDAEAVDAPQSITFPLGRTNWPLSLTMVDVYIGDKHVGTCDGVLFTSINDYE